MQGSTRIDELRQKFHENPRRYFAPLANEYRKAGDPEQAIAICRAHLAQQPGHMSGHVVYGQALFDANRKEEAREVFEKALALDPDNAIVLKQLGDIAREKGDSGEARHWYSRAIDLDPGDREVAAYIAELTEPETEEAAAPASAAPSIPDRSDVEPSFIESSFVESSFVESSAIESSAIESSAIESSAVESSEVGSSQQSAAAPEREEPVTVEREPEIAAQEPEVEPEPAIPPVDVESEPAPAADETAWRKTPPHEDSPFVTRTMAELYASQGYRQAALEVYRQLALHHPDDKEIFDRIEALERDESQESAPASETVAESRAETPVESRAETPAPDLIPFEPLISDLPVEPDEMDIDKGPAFPPGDEDLNLETITGAAPGPTPHFTEVELGNAGDSWDADSWGAGFDSDEDVNLDFDSPDIPSAPVETPAAGEPADEAQPAVEESQESPPIQATAPVDVPVINEPITEMIPPIGDVPVEPAAEYPPEPAPEEEIPEEEIPEEEIPEEEIPEESAQEEEVPEAKVLEPEFHAEYEPEPEEASFVAYSPQLPEEEDLPHYTPQHPTVREFFAALGAFRPSSGGNVFTAHAAATETAPAAPDSESSVEDYPLANDAFANLFGDAPVDEDDNRAAYALSGAIGASTPPSNVAVSAPTEPQPAPEPPATDAPAQESEEDIRRFREWLDGLAES
jgi:tetratricopeptide (TPR) repeat protein